MVYVRTAKIHAIKFQFFDEKLIGKTFLRPRDVSDFNFIISRSS